MIQTLSTVISWLTLSGRIYVNAYRGADGEAKASLNCHVNNIKIHAFGKQETTSTKIETISKTKEEVGDDLPF